MPVTETRENESSSSAVPLALPAPGQTAPESDGSGSSSRSGSLIRKIGLAVVVLAAIAFGYWKVEGNKKEAGDVANKAAAAANRAIPVTAATIASRTMPIYLTALGTVTAYNTVTVKSRVDGQLLSVPVREGQRVRKGQTLATIDPRPYEAAVAQAQGQLAKDQATADYTKAEAGRYSALYAAGVVSKESQQSQASNAGQSVGVLEADRAAIQAAKVNVAYTHITSPIDGVVGLRQVDAGNIVHASDANGLLVVTQLQPIAVIFTLPEDQLPTVTDTIRAGKTLVVEAYDRSETTHLATGKLLTLDNQIDTTTGTVKAKAVFDNKDGALFPNQFVNVRLILEQRSNSIVMPSAALQNGSSGTFVYLIKPGNPPQNADDGSGNAAAAGGKGKRAGGGAAGAPAGAGAGAAGGPAESGPPRDPYYVTVQDVVVDLTEGTQVILKGGLKAGDQVVVDGAEKLKPFSKVDPKASQGRSGGRGGAGAASSSGLGAGSSSQNLGPVEGASGGNAAKSAAVSQDENKAPRHAPAGLPLDAQPGTPPNAQGNPRDVVDPSAQPAAPRHKGLHAKPEGQP